MFFFVFFYRRVTVYIIVTMVTFYVANVNSKDYNTSIQVYDYEGCGNSNNTKISELSLADMYNCPENYMNLRECLT